MYLELGLQWLGPKERKPIDWRHAANLSFEGYDHDSSIQSSKRGSTGFPTLPHRCFTKTNSNNPFQIQTSDPPPRKIPSFNDCNVDCAESQKLWWCVGGFDSLPVSFFFNGFDSWISGLHPFLTLPWFSSFDSWIFINPIQLIQFCC